MTTVVNTGNDLWPASPFACGSSGYYRFVRSEIAPLLPATVSRVLDVGAGVGATSAWIRERFPGCSTVALEGEASAAAELRTNVDEFRIVDLNLALPDVGSPDLVLLLDVLEHLMDPWDVLRRVTAIMAPHGTVIISLPNIAHLSVSLPLFLRANFAYQGAGILDRTHLRFLCESPSLR